MRLILVRDVDTLSVVPQRFEAVELSRWAVEDVEDDLVVVEEDPSSVLAALVVKRFLVKVLKHAIPYRISYSICLSGTISVANNVIVAYRTIYTAKVKDGNILSLFVFDSFND